MVDVLRREAWLVLAWLGVVIVACGVAIAATVPAEIDENGRLGLSLPLVPKPEG